MIFATSSACSKLTSRMQEIEVVAADEMLSQIHDSHGQGLFAVMMSGMFANVANKLANL